MPAYAIAVASTHSCPSSHAMLVHVFVWSTCRIQADGNCTFVLYLCIHKLHIRVYAYMQVCVYICKCIYIHISIHMRTHTLDWGISHLDEFPTLLSCMGVKTLAPALQWDRNAASNCLPDPATSQLWKWSSLSILGVWSHTLSAEGLSVFVRWPFQGCCRLSISHLLKVMATYLIAPYTCSALDFFFFFNESWVKKQLHLPLALTDWRRQRSSHEGEWELGTAWVC